MAKTVFQVYVEDEGVIVPSPTVTVRKMSDNSLATIYDDDSGSPKTNPFTGTVNGFVNFYADAGSYKVIAVSGLFSTSFEDVLLGNSQGYDVANSANSLMTRAQNDARYIQLGSALSNLVDTQYFTTQNPTAVDTAMQIIFNNASVSSAFVNVLGAADGTPSNRGKINWLAACECFFTIELALGRTSSTSNCALVLVFLENGVVIASKAITLLDSSDTSVTFTSTEPVKITGASTWTFELYRDSSGDDDGGLIGFNPALAGLPNVPSARIKINKIF